MVSKEIENIAKKRKNISEEFFKAKPERESALSTAKNSRNNKNLPNMDIPEEMKNELKEFYIGKIGEDNIKNSPDYDTDLIRIHDLGTIKDLNFQDSFIKVFIISLFVMFFFYFLFGILGVLFGGIISLFALLMAWIVPLLALWIFYSDYRDEERHIMKSSKKSESEKQKVSRVKYAPVVSFLILVLCNAISGMFLMGM